MSSSVILNKNNITSINNNQLTYKFPTSIKLDNHKVAMANIHNLFFLKIRKMGLTECVGRP